MSCCSDNTPADLLPAAGSKQEGDLLAKRMYRAKQRVYGRASGRYYGKIGGDDLVWVDPRDVKMEVRGWVVVPEAHVLSPGQEDIDAALAVDENDPIAVLEAKIKKAGVRASFAPPVPYGYDMQQDPRELATFLHAMQEAGVKTVLEIGTGDNAGLVRFMAADLGWQVTSVDVNPPTPITHPTKENEMPANWHFIQGDSKTVDLPDDQYDLVFIDGDHSYAGLEADWKRFSKLGKIIAVHDISPTGFFVDDVTSFWKQTAYTTAKGNLRAGFHEVIEDGSRLGIGWYVHK